jgi:hypothetical protein
MAVAPCFSRSFPGSGAPVCATAGVSSGARCQARPAFSPWCSSSLSAVASSRGTKNRRTASSRYPSRPPPSNRASRPSPRPQRRVRATRIAPRRDPPRRAPSPHLARPPPRRPPRHHRQRIPHLLPHPPTRPLQRPAQPALPRSRSTRAASRSASRRCKRACRNRPRSTAASRASSRWPSAARRSTTVARSAGFRISQGVGRAGNRRKNWAGSTPPAGRRPAETTCKTSAEQIDGPGMDTTSRNNRRGRRPVALSCHPRHDSSFAQRKQTFHDLTQQPPRPAPCCSHLPSSPRLLLRPTQTASPRPHETTGEAGALFVATAPLFAQHELKPSG